MNNLLSSALCAFCASVDTDTEAYHAKHLSNLEPEKLKVAGGNKYIKIVKGCSVYCFIAAVDVPEKRVKAGDILFPASWKAPQLKGVGSPSRGSIFDSSTYEGVDKTYTGWMYRKN